MIDENESRVRLAPLLVVAITLAALSAAGCVFLDTSPPISEGCKEPLVPVQYLTGVRTDEMKGLERRGDAVVSSTDNVEPDRKAYVCMSQHKYRVENHTEWHPLPPDWGTAAVKTKVENASL